MIIPARMVMEEKRTWLLLFVRLVAAHDEVIATILLPAAFIRLVTDWQFLTIADGGDSARRNSQRRKVILGRLRALGAECDVVLLGSALVAIALDLHMGTRMILQPGRIAAKDGTVLRLHGVIVVSEVNIRQWATGAADDSLVFVFIQRAFLGHVAADRRAAIAEAFHAL